MADKKIVVIDDEKDIIQLLSLELKAAGYEVVTACDGEAGLALIRAQRPDLVLLDLMMPKKDGFEVLEALRRDAVTRNIPVFLLTAKSSDHDIERGLQLGIEDYIVKPFHGELLVKRIGRLLS